MSRKTVLLFKVITVCELGLTKCWGVTTVFGCGVAGPFKCKCVLYSEKVKDSGLDDMRKVAS